MSLYKQALEYANRKHGETKKLYNGFPFIVHPQSVGSIITHISMDDENLQCAALLHDILEDTEVTYHELRQLFGKDIADLVKEVTKDDNGDFPDLKTERGLKLKLADTLSNVSNLKGLKDKKKEKRLLKKYLIPIKYQATFRKSGIIKV